MSFNKFPYTNFNELNMDFMLDELGKKITAPETAENGQVLKYNGTTKEWEAGASASGVPASEVTMTAQTLINTDNVQSGINKIDSELRARPIKSIRLNNVPISPDANGMVNIVIADGNNILY